MPVNHHHSQHGFWSWGNKQGETRPHVHLFYGLCSRGTTSIFFPTSEQGCPIIDSGAGRLQRYLSYSSPPTFVLIKRAKTQPWKLLWLAERLRPSWVLAIHKQPLAPMTPSYIHNHSCCFSKNFDLVSWHWWDYRNDVWDKTKPFIGP